MAYANGAVCNMRLPCITYGKGKSAGNVDGIIAMLP